MGFGSGVVRQGWGLGWGHISGSVVGLVLLRPLAIVSCPQPSASPSPLPSPLPSPYPRQVSKGDVLDQELAAVKIDGDVDEVSRESNPNPNPTQP